MFASAAATLAAQSQTAQAAQAKASAAGNEGNENDEVIMLNKFQVTSEKEQNYTASETVTGTRIATKIRDLPFMVDVVTADFLQDFAAFDMSQQLGWVGNVSPSDTDGSLVLRGFTSTPYVDGFRRLGPLDLVDTARVEIIKGPAASIYGQTLPGGVVNYSSKRPKSKPEQSIGLTVGNEGLFRAEASSTGPVGNSKKLFYMVNLAASTRNFEQEWAGQRRKNASVNFTYKVDDDTSFYIKFASQFNRNRDRQSLPWIKTSTAGFLTNNNGQLGMNADGTALKYTYTSLKYNTTTGAYATSTTTANLPLPQVIVKYNMTQDDLDKYNAYIANPSAWSTPLVLSSQLQTTNSWDRLATEYPRLHTNGPLSYSKNKLLSATMGGDHRWNDLLSSKFTFDIFNRPNESQTISGNQMYLTDPNYPDGNVGASTPTWREQYSKGYSTQLDNLFTFHTGPVKHQFLVTMDYTHKTDRDWRVTTDTSNTYPSGDLSNKYLIRDKNDNSVIYPLTLPLGPRSTGAYRWNGTTLSYTSGEQLLAWPYTDASYWFPTYDKYSQLYTKTSNNTLGMSDDYGVFASERATFFKGRLTALAGGRFDYMRNTYKNYAATDAASQKSKWDEQARTYQLGLTGYATKNIILFANKSTAYNPNMQVVNRRVPLATTIGDDGETVVTDYRFEPVVMPNETGKGYEFGTRFLMFGDRLNVSLSRFVIDQQNKVDSYTNEFGMSEYVGEGARRSKGYEADINWAVTPAFQVNFIYGYNDTVYTKNSLAYLVGSPTPQNSKNNYGVVLLYNVRQGMFRGLRFTAGFRYYDRSLINVGSGGFVTTNPYTTSGFKPIIRNTALASGTLPFPDLPEGLVVLSRNCDVSTTSSGKRVGGSEPTGAINPSSGAVLVNNQLDKGYVQGINIPAAWLPYTGQAMEEDKTYYILDGDGKTAASYTRKTNIDDNRSNVYNHAYALWDFGVGYNFKQGKRFSHTVRANVKNAFDKFYTYGNGVLGYGREYSLSYSLSFR